MINKNKTIRNFWILFFGIIASLAILSGVFYYVTLTDVIARQKANTITDDNVYKISLQGSCEQILYNSIEDLTAINTAIDRTLLTNDAKFQQQQLIDIAVSSYSLSNDVAQMPLCCGDRMYEVETFANQLYGYSRSLCDSLSVGKTLTTKDMTNLTAINNTANAVKQALIAIADGNCGMHIVNTLRLDGSNIINDVIDNIESKDLNYGKLDYQGQFSESSNKPISMGDKLNSQQIKQHVTKLLTDSNNETVVGVDINSIINNGGEMYYMTATVEDGAKIEIVATVDGRLVELDYHNYDADTKQTHDNKACAQIAEKYCHSINYQVTAYNSSVQEGVVYVTLYPSVSDVIVLSDYVLVAVDNTTGKVIGLQARAYLNNTQQDQTIWGEYTVEQAKQLANSKAKFISADKVVYSKYDKQYGCHRLNYEYNNTTYSIIVDSSNGKCIDILSA